MTRVILFFLIGTSFCFAQVSLKLNEVMFYPLSGDNEFIEIYNNAPAGIDLNGFKIKYYNSSPDVIIDGGEGTILQPNRYAVILEADYDPETGIYKELLPQDALILKISDNYFGSTGMANTSDRPIWLLTDQGDTLDVYTYSAENTQAHSDEKILFGADSSQSNWSNSLSPNGTPGFRNSVIPLGYDLGISSILISPALPIEGDDVLIGCKIKNTGMQPADYFSIFIYNDSNLDSIPQPGEMIFSNEYYNLQTGDSLVAETQISTILTGIYNIICKVDFTPDENIINNSAVKNFIVYPGGSDYNDIVINEIMYAPASGEPEWLEIYNRSSGEINLNGWRFCDYSAERVITHEDVVLSPGEFVVLTRDSSILTFYDIESRVIEFSLPALNNTGDAAVIKDSLGFIIDSLIYSSDWGGNAGRSLERISTDEASYSRDNWTSCESSYNATPGQINSVTPKTNDLKISSFETSEFAIIGESAMFNITIKNAGLNTSSPFTLQLFYDSNQDSVIQSTELVSSINAGALFPGDTAAVVLSVPIFEAGRNFFIAKIDVSPDDDLTNNIAFTDFVGIEVYEFRNDLVINELMYDPSGIQPEWIEVINRSAMPIDLRKHQLADARDTITFCSEDIVLPPGGFAVISRDSTIRNYFDISVPLLIKAFPSLNNSGDKLILLDSLDRVIDSLEYASSWGGGNGISLERINADSSSLNMDNWGNSINRFRATPGYINSLTPKEYDISVTGIISSPEYPVFGDDVTLKVKIKNPGLSSTACSLRLFEDSDLDSIPDLLLTSINGLTLEPGDSTIIEPGYIAANLSGLHIFYADVFSPVDMDTSNNFAISKIYPGYPPLTLIINEVMYSPEGGEPEWLEFYNKSTDSIHLKDWTINDVISIPSLTEIDTDMVILPGRYIVISKDSSILNYHRLIPSPLAVYNLPVLNNDADGVVLKDERGQTIDSLFFSSKWGNKRGYSLERISLSGLTNLSSNWGSSEDIELSTPGRVNSITLKDKDAAVIRISSNPEFPVERDNVIITAVIKNKGTLNAAGIDVEFYIDSDSNNTAEKLISVQRGISLAAGDSLQISSAVSLDNLTGEVLTAVRIIYPGDEDTLNNYGERIVGPGYGMRSVIINEIMYDPLDDEPEWFEITNISSDTINLKGWSCSDNPGAAAGSTITENDYDLYPGNFTVIAKDTSFASFHPEAANFFVTNFGTLGNSGDNIILYDFRGGIVDSIHYLSAWGGQDGFSLEKIEASDTLNNTGRWASSISSGKCTPDRENSLSGIPPGEKNTVIINEIMFDPGIDNCEFIELYNGTRDTINIGGWIFEEARGKRFRISDSYFNLPPEGYYLLSADTSIFSVYSPDEFNNFRLAGTTDLGLSNEGELILLKDVQGNIIDSIVYSSGWHNRNINNTKNKSLERINPGLSGNYNRNWSTSVAGKGSTPGGQNSIFTENKKHEAGISVSPNPFSPDDDGFEDFCIINYSLTQPVSQIRIKIFDNRGRVVRTLENNVPSDVSGSVVYDGLEDNGRPLRIGIYIIYLEALNQNTGTVDILKTVVVAARKF